MNDEKQIAGWVQEDEFFDCKITSCAYYDTCETQDDRDKNRCDIKGE